MLCAPCQEHTATVTGSGERVRTEPPPPLISSRIAANALNEGRRGKASAAFATSLDLAGRRTKHLTCPQSHPESSGRDSPPGWSSMIGGGVSHTS